jgi:uridine kinase
VKYLELEFSKRGKKSLVVSMDDWLLPAEERTDEMTVADRFRIGTFAEDFGRILRGESVSVDTYEPKTRTRTGEKTYKTGDEDFILLDGVLALYSEQVRSLADIRVFVEVSEEERKAAFRRFYEWKGMDLLTIEEMYSTRVSEEKTCVDETSRFADFIIKRQK